jgi:hypothetical protein
VLAGNAVAADATLHRFLQAHHDGQCEEGGEMERSAKR